MIQQIVKYPSKCLGQECPIEIYPQGPEVEKAVQDLLDTAQQHETCLGLSAPQIGEMRRAFVIRRSLIQGISDLTPQLPGRNDTFAYFVNPDYTTTTKSKLVVGPEACMSYPAFRPRKVARWSEIFASYQDITGKDYTVHLFGLAAIVFQHEYDHLKGKTIYQENYEHKHKNRN